MSQWQIIMIKKTLNPYRCKDCSKKTCSPVLLSFQKKHVLMFFCLFKKTCPHVLMSFKKTCPHVPMSFKKNMSSCSHVFQTKTCPHVLMSFKKKTCPHVLMSFKKKHVLLSFQKPCSHVSTCPHSKIKDTFIQLKFSFCVII